jgi:hypothetical protein
MIYLVVDGYKQNVVKVVFPRSKDSSMYIETPKIILEPVDDWINNKEPKNIELNYMSKKYMLVNAIAINSSDYDYKRIEIKYEYITVK